MLMKTKTLRAQALLDFVRMLLDRSKVQDSAHDLDHVLRVWKIGTIIGDAEKADMEILEPALLLHDIIRPDSFLDEKEIKSKKAKKDNHAIESARLSRKILPDFSYKEEEIERIAHAIQTHHKTKDTEVPQTLEAKIVYDADSYDILGFSGCGRAALFCAKEKMNTSKMAEWYLAKIKNLLSGAPFYTPSAIALANTRLTISLDFCKELLGKDRFEDLMKR
ncbi:HD domain protein [uncultured archaeon]|nr:HD domain protein [uncultured archaeon]